MSKAIGILVILFLVGACSKSQKPEVVGTTAPSASSAPTPGGESVNFDSPITYQYSTLEDQTQAAQVQGQPVSWSQLSSNEPALIELEQRWSYLVISFANSVTKDLMAQKKLPEEGAEIQLFLPEPKDLEKAGVMDSKNVSTVFSGFGHPSLVAQIGDTSVSHAEVVGASLENSRLYKNLFVQRMRRLDGIVIRRSLLKASKDESMAMEAFVQKNIIQSPISASVDDARAYAVEKGISESDLSEEMLERLKAIVAQKKRDRQISAYVAKKGITSPVLINFLVPQDKVEVPALSDAIPNYGEEKGKDLVYIGHWSCESCKETLNFFLQGQKNWANKVKGTFLYYFQDQDREARMSAEAGLCLHSQKPDYFWDFIGKSLKEEAPNSEATINKVAKDVGADYEVFRKCFLAREHKDEVNQQLALVKTMGVTRPPLIVVEGQAYEQPKNLESITAALGLSKGLLQKAKVSLTDSSNKAGKAPGFFARIWNFFMSFFR